MHGCICECRPTLTQLKDLQGHGEPGLLGPHQRPVAGAEVLTGRQQQQHGQLVSELHQLTGVHTVLISLSQIQNMTKCYDALLEALCSIELHHVLSFRNNNSTKGDVLGDLNQFYPVEGDVELCQEMRDCKPQRPDELHQAAALHQALVLATQQVLNTAIGCGVNMTLKPRPLLPVTTTTQLTQHCNKEVETAKVQKPSV